MSTNTNTLPQRLNIHSQNFQRCNLKHRNIEYMVANTDILLAQEIHLHTNTKQRDMEITKLELKWNRKIYTSTPVKDAHIAIITKPHIYNDIKKYTELVKGRAQLIHIQKCRIQLQHCKYIWSSTGVPRYETLLQPAF